MDDITDDVDNDLQRTTFSARILDCLHVARRRIRESRQERLSRWRFDILIAATALAHDMPLVHNNPDDFELLRRAIEWFPEKFPGVVPLNLISAKRLAA